jgi:hypothetical protein
MNDKEMLDCLLETIRQRASLNLDSIDWRNLTSLDLENEERAIIGVMVMEAAATAKKRSW